MKRKRFFSVFLALLVFSPFILSAQEQPHDFWDGFWDYQGPVLSMAQASVGFYASIMLTDYISRQFFSDANMTVNQPLLISTSIGLGTSMVLLGKLGHYLGWSPAVYYPLTMIIPLTLPEFEFGMNLKEFGIYTLVALSTSFLSHVIFSVFFGYNNYMPFLKIDPIWEW
jgi:hypothetical protein